MSQQTQQSALFDVELQSNELQSNELESIDSLIIEESINVDYDHYNSSLFGQIRGFYKYMNNNFMDKKTRINITGGVMSCLNIFIIILNICLMYILGCWFASEYKGREAYYTITMPKSELPLNYKLITIGCNGTEYICDKCNLDTCDINVYFTPMIFLFGFMCEIIIVSVIFIIMFGFFLIYMILDLIITNIRNCVKSINTISKEYHQFNQTIKQKKTEYNYYNKSYFENIREYCKFLNSTDKKIQSAIDDINIGIITSLIIIGIILSLLFMYYVSYWYVSYSKNPIHYTKIVMSISELPLDYVLITDGCNNTESDKICDWCDSNTCNINVINISTVLTICFAGEILIIASILLLTITLCGLFSLLKKFSISIYKCISSVNDNWKQYQQYRQSIKEKVSENKIEFI